MKPILFSLVAFPFLFFGCNHRHKIKSDLEELGFKTKIKSIREISYKPIETKDGISKGKRSYETYTVYNKDGNIVEESRYNSDGDMTKKLVIAYDTEGRKIEEADRLFSIIKNKITGERFAEKEREFELCYNEKFTYNDDETINEVYHSEMHGTTKRDEFKSEYKYDSNRNLIEISTPNYSALKISLTRFKYDNKGNKIEKSVFENHAFSKDSSFIEKETYSYDVRDNLIELCHYSSDKKYNYKRTYTYDSDNRMQKDCYFNSGGSLDNETTYKYDKGGKLIESNYHNLSDGYNSRSTYTRENDKFNNWIRIIEYVDGNAYNIAERDIVYQE